VTGKKQDKQIAAEPPLTPAAGIPPVVVWLVCAYIILMPIGDAVIHWSSRFFSPGNEITFDRSRFSAVNAATLTGFQSVMGINNYAAPARAAVVLLMAAGAYVTMVVGGMAVVRIVRMPYSDGQVLRAGAVALAVLTVAGAVPLIAADRDPFEALVLSLGALGNCGLFFGSLPDLMSWQTQVVLLPLAVLGGLGLPVLMELHDASRLRRSLSKHSRVVLAMTAGTYLAGFAACLGLQWIDAALNGGGMNLRMAASSSTLAINVRTAGLPFQYVQDFPRTLPWVLMLLMVIGGGPAGTAGGVKVTTIYELWRGVRRALRGQPVGRSFGIAATWLALYAGLALVSLLALLATLPQIGADRLAFECISALSNVGLSHEVIMVVGSGLDVFTGTMLLGRIVPLGVLWWMAGSVRDAEVAIG
jgi:Trk-type K+ transport system membrane component